MTASASNNEAPGRESPLRVKRAPRHILVGVGLMAASALIFAVLALRADPATPVFAIARPVAAGETITDAHLDVVRVAPDGGVELVAESRRSTVVGRTATVPLLPGSLLTPSQVGAAAWPPAGDSVVAVPVAAGRLPSGLSTGSRIRVLLPPVPAAEGTEPAVPPLTLSASVVTVEPPTAAGVSTVSLLMSAAGAQQVAAAGAEVVLLLDSPLTTGTGG